MRRESPVYAFAFVAAVCAASALLVAAASVGLAERQREAQTRHVQMTVLLEVGGVLDGAGAGASRRDLFRERLRPRLVDLRSGAYVDDPAIDPLAHDARRARDDPTASREAPPNDAQVRRVPHRVAVYEVLDGGEPVRVLLPIDGQGLYGPMRGFIALERDGRTVAGLVFHDQGETPGLGGEVANPRWRALWPGRQATDEAGAVRIEVVKGRAGPPAQDPYRVDGLTGATITGRAVTDILAFWLGEHGFGPYLARLRASGAL